MAVLNIILIIVVVIAVLVLCILFLPVRYQVNGDIDSKYLRFSVSYFFKIIGFKADISDGGIDYYLSLFGRRTSILDEEQREKRKEKRKLKKAKKARKKKLKLMREKEKAHDKRSRKTGGVSIEELAAAGGSDQSFSKSGSSEICSVQDRTSHKANDTLSEDFSDDDDQLSVDEEGSFSRIIAKVKKIYNILQAFNRYQPMALVLPYVKLLLYRIKPQYIKGDISFGFQDPATTGKVLGGLSMLLFIYEYPDFHIEPDFDSEEMFISGNGELYGNIRVIYLLVFFISIFKQKAFRQFLKAVRR